jgi:hypothetical protein
MRRPNRRNKAAGLSSVTHSLIDQQILILHRAMAEKLYTHPELVEQVKSTLQQRLENGTTRYGAFITWQCILDQIADKEAFFAAILEDSDLMRKYRRSTPLVGILTEQERQQVLMMHVITDTIM